MAITGDDSLTSDKTVRELQSQIKELERQLGRKTMEVEILVKLSNRADSPSQVLVAINTHNNRTSLASFINLVSV